MDYIKTVRMYNAKNKAKEIKTSVIDDSGRTLARKLSKLVHVTPIEHSEMTKALILNNEGWTPEEYKAYCYIEVGIFVFAGIIILTIGVIWNSGLINFLGIVAVILGVILYFLKRRSFVKENNIEY